MIWDTNETTPSSCQHGTSPLSCCGALTKQIQEQTQFRPTAIAHDSYNLGYHTFLVPPDGSKEGWEESHRGDRERDVVVKILRSYEYEDGSNPLHWVEVQYHDDNGDDKVTRSGKWIGREAGLASC